MTAPHRRAKRTAGPSLQDGPNVPSTTSRKAPGPDGKTLGAGDGLAAVVAVPRRQWRDAVPNDRLAHVVKDLLRGFTRGLQIRLMDHSVSYGYWAFLRVLWEHDGITQRELAEMAGVTEPTTYSALKAMESLGYVTRKKLPSNLRNVCIELTPQGQALKAILIPLAEDLNAVAIRGIAPEDLAVFRRTAVRMMNNLEQDELEKDRALPPLRKPV
jgi:DNA-binding MarR family transcriptional regulator